MSNENAATVRVCAISDAECSRGCASGACKREAEDPCVAHPKDASIQPEPRTADEAVYRFGYDGVCRIQSARTDEQAAFVELMGYDRPETEGIAQDVWDSQRGAWLEALDYARASSPNAAGAEAASELASMTRMFHAACHDLGLINEALGLDPEDGGAEPILDAIQKLKDERDQWVDANYAAPAQAAEPVCWITKEQLEQLEDLTSDAWVYWRETGHVTEDDELALYTAPPPPAPASAPVGLTDEDIESMANACGLHGVRQAVVKCVRALLATQQPEPRASLTDDHRDKIERAEACLRGRGPEHVEAANGLLEVLIAHPVQPEPQASAGVIAAAIAVIECDRAHVLTDEHIDALDNAIKIQRGELKLPEPRVEVTEEQPSLTNPLTPYGMLVRALRIVTGTLLGDMAKSLNIPSAQVSAMEFGRAPVTLDFALDVAAYFDVLGVPDTLVAIRRAIDAGRAGEAS
ncbi:helix-turn-helix domain-containing protein [Burkholderia sola]|uniref:helix-turn-helix domain-containing protein n=1 Tax=Burkholderia TaxID=32008 RepID=UPI001AE34F3E|nr:helix-turn-helix domain-containing protein [Burkholderia sp. AcTa6-5]MBP0714835.1 helix-turn-helix transcriptional regulator [Burkholderia sp. AcTa6-5]